MKGLDVTPCKLNSSHIIQAQNRRLGKFFSPISCVTFEVSRFVEFL